jgi:putative copper export protein
VDATHALAASGWAGAILVISATALPSLALVTTEDRLTVARNLLRAFSPLALVCAVILAATGIASAWLQLRDVDLLLNSPYGLALIRKVVVVLLIVALGAYHWRVAQPSLDTERSLVRLRTSLALDVMLVVLILALTAVLTGTAPPVR